MFAFTITERVDPAQLGVLREDNKLKEKRISVLEKERLAH
jgi:hypothetical protein